ncbi:MAG: hypothetical protein OXT65_08655 [Alphaproteobacteria bacterium]|nr:hypothetical protein [Alphaproteobacteria bacterium]
MGTAPSASEIVAHEVLRVLQDTEGSADLFGGDAELKATLDSVTQMDRSFEQNGGVFFQAGNDAFETAQTFTDIHVEQYRETGRPSMPALAVHHAEQLGLEQETPEYKALLLVAMRAETKAAAEPDYHSKHHYMDVAAVTATALKANNDMCDMEHPDAVPLTKQEQALTLIAAIGHDLEHDGGKNPKENHYFYEQKSLDAMHPLLEAAGLEQNDIQKIDMIVLGTSPDGPHAVLKNTAKAALNDEAPDMAKIDPENKFPEIHGLAATPAMAQMAAIVADADVYASSGAGMESNVKMSALFTDELQSAGIPMDLRTDGARKFFLNNIVGEDGYASKSMRALANESFHALREETERRLEAPAPSAPETTTPSTPPVKSNFTGPK